MAMRYETLTILDGTAVTSASVKLWPGELLAGVLIPTSWSAADLGFQVSLDNVTFNDIVDPAQPAAASYARIPNIAIADEAVYAVPSVLDLQLGQHFKLTSLTVGAITTANQTGDIVLTVIIEKSY